MTPVEPLRPPWQALYELRVEARERFADPDLRQRVRNAGAKLIAQLRAELCAIQAGRRFDGTSASYGLKGLDRDVRLDLLNLVFERNDRPTFMLVPSSPDGDWSGIAEAGLDVEGCKALFAGQALKRHPFAYQEEGLRNGSITLPSPFDGEPLRSSGSLIAFERPGCPVLFYVFQDVEPFLAVVSPYRGEIVGLLLPNRRLLVGVERVSKYHAALTMLKALMIEFSQDVAHYLGSRPPLIPALLSGSMNHFGHSILNEYEAVHQLVENGSASCARRNIDYGIEYVSFNDVFPELGQLEAVRPDGPEELFSYILKSGSFIVRPTCGDYYFSRGLRGRLLRASSHIDRYAWLCGKWPVIWLEVRTGHRIWTDQIDGMVALIEAMAADFPDLVVLIGGWSQPSRGLDDATDTAMIDAHTRVVEAVRGRLSADNRIVDLVGASTVEKISAAQWADSFVAGFGTAMIFPLGIGQATGVAHTNSAFLKELNQDGLLSMFEELGSVIMTDADPANDVTSDMHYHHWNYVADWKVMYARLTDVLKQQDRAGKKV